jgi:hypothetical protein
MMKNVLINRNAGSSSFNAAPYGSGGGGSSSFASSGSSSFSFGGELLIDFAYNKQKCKIKIIEFPLVQCSGKPKQVGNSRLSCSPTACQTTCLEGYKFPTGETVMSHICNNGQWIVKHLELNEVPECERN